MWDKVTARISGKIKFGLVPGLFFLRRYGLKLDLVFVRMLEA